MVMGRDECCVCSVRRYLQNRFAACPAVLELVCESVSRSPVFTKVLCIDALALPCPPEN